MKLAEIARALGCPAENLPEIEIAGVAAMERAGAGDLTVHPDLAGRDRVVAGAKKPLGKGPLNR